MAPPPPPPPSHPQLPRRLLLMEKHHPLHVAWTQPKWLKVYCTMHIHVQLYNVHVDNMEGRSALGKRPLPGKCPCNCFGCSNGKRPFLGKRPGNVSQDCSNDEADENTYEDDGDVDELDSFSDSDE